MLLALTAGCVSRTGDLGRPDPRYATAVSHASILQPHFNKTDQEQEMEDRIWRFLHAPHVSGWFVSLPIARQALSADARAGERARYLNWLRKTPYRSSTVRYLTIADHVQADLGTLPGTFAAICAVGEVDRQRNVALSQEAAFEVGIETRVMARARENAATIAKFGAALRLRYESYSYALDNLLVETPHEEAVEVDALLAELAIYAEDAERGRFCG